MSKTKLLVTTETTKYPIHIQSGLLANLSESLTKLGVAQQASDVFIISNETVFSLYGELVKRAFNSTGKKVHIYLLPDGEQYKSWDMAEQVLAFALEKRFTRKTLLIALGGGVVGDIAGFIAAIYMRGLPFIQIPTTLLAQVDSSVGGKVAVNHPLGKNMIGAFYHPRAVFMDVDTLTTLPEREMLAGLSEVLKYGVIWDEDFFWELQSKRDLIIARDRDALNSVIHRCCEIKAEIVGQDEREQNLRAILNFGHTIGHSLERATKYQVYRHGEAVSIGMVAATKLSKLMGFIDRETSEVIISTLQQWGLPTKLPQISYEKIIEGAKHDKKNSDQNISFILPCAIGSVELIKIDDERLIKEALTTMEID